MGKSTIGQGLRSGRKCRAPDAPPFLRKAFDSAAAYDPIAVIANESATIKKQPLHSRFLKYGSNGNVICSPSALQKRLSDTI